MVSIQVTDDFLTEETFKLLQSYSEQEFKIHEISGKKFSLLQTPKDLLPLLEIKGLEQVVSFIRSAYNGFDEDLRIHADNIIDGKRIEYASILYINDSDGVTPNGTAFYKHKKYGSRLPKNVSPEEYDRTINCDSENEDMWITTDMISAVPNRYMIYEANLFHGKQPKKIKKGVRKVLVTFYTKPSISK